MPRSRFGTSAVAKKRPTDKRVFEVWAGTDAGDERRWCRLAISADSTIVDLYLALLGAFEWDGNYDSAERDYRIAFGQRVFADGKGSRTPLRRVFEVGDSFTCDAPEFFISCDVPKSYEVSSRRHDPKVLDGGGPRFSQQAATWRAQSAMRRELRGTRALPATSELLEARLHGFFAAVVSGPLVMPSEWLHYVTDFSAIPDGQAAQALVSGVMELYNRVAGQLHERQDEFIAHVSSLQNLDASGQGLVEWCAGYFDGIELRAVEWEKFTRDKSIREVFMPLAMTRECEQDRAKRAWLSDAQFRTNIAQALGVAAVVIRDYWRRRLFPGSGTQRRSEPKISPNEPCPCGSGAKYKRCCGSRLRLVLD